MIDMNLINIQMDKAVRGIVASACGEEAADIAVNNLSKAEKKKFTDDVGTAIGGLVYILEDKGFIDAYANYLSSIYGQGAGEAFKSIFKHD